MKRLKKYVAEHNDGMKVSSLYIAQVKRKCGIELGENFNLPKSENAKQPQCSRGERGCDCGGFEIFSDDLNVTKGF